MKNFNKYLDENAVMVPFSDEEYGLCKHHEAVGDKSALLSASVSVAMNTTAFGLMVVIPLLLIYVMIDNASSKAMESLQMGCATVMNKLYQKRA